MELRWHQYRYYPYERELALKEVNSLLSPKSIIETKNGIRIEGFTNLKKTERLVYFAEALNGDHSILTLQARFERMNGNSQKRQSTRYSVHGLHEYKGKFNPQIARGILNILRISPSANVLDPFCGSGTTLVECSHLGIKAVGTDINPLAIFIANAKLAALQLSPSLLRKEKDLVIRRFNTTHSTIYRFGKERQEYLQRWFVFPIFNQIEKLRTSIEKGDAACAQPLLVIASNLLREYSQQDPHDLRIRRRKSSLPKIPFIGAFEAAVNLFISRLENAQEALAKKPTLCKALLLDSRLITPGHGGLSRAKFDCVLTSPPYATALPYIDTQRLSLVWLDLLPPSEILQLESQLIGSRDIWGENKKELLQNLLQNRKSLPKKQTDFCRKLQAALSNGDGFRRQAVPLLLYRYFVGMAEAFKSIRLCVKDSAPFTLIVGSNHTILGGKRFEICTPQHLADIANYCGWSNEKMIPLQTYQRYGYNQNNAVNSETLVLLRAI